MKVSDTFLTRSNYFQVFIVSSSFLICFFRAEHRNEAKPLYPKLLTNADSINSNEHNGYPDTSALLLKDILLDNHHDDNLLPSKQHNYPTQAKNSTPINSHQKQHNFNEHKPDQHRQQTTSDKDSNGVVFLLNANEQLTVKKI